MVYAKCKQPCSFLVDTQGTLLMKEMESSISSFYVGEKVMAGEESKNSAQTNHCENGCLDHTGPPHK